MSDPTQTTSKELIQRMRLLWKRIEPGTDDVVLMTQVSATLAEAAIELEKLQCEHSALLRGRVPTHRCKVCGALWTLWAAQPGKYPIDHPLHEASWSLFSLHCGQCCDNVAMGDQIEPIALAAPVGRDAPCPSHAHPSCPLCNPDKTVPELNRAGVYSQHEARELAFGKQPSHEPGALRDGGLRDLVIALHPYVESYDCADAAELEAKAHILHQCAALTKGGE